MDIKRAKQINKKAKAKQVTIDNKTFIITALNDIEMQELYFKAQRENKEPEIYIILNSVINYAGLKYKDVLVDADGITEEELNEEVKEFDKELLAEFLGNNQEIMVNLYSEIAKHYGEYKNKVAELKKN